MKNSILVALNDSLSSRAMLEYLGNLPFCPEDVHITLLHVFRKPSGGEELMGKKFMNRQPDKYMKTLEQAKNKLIESGFIPDHIEIKLITEPYTTIADGIIDQFKKGSYDTVVIGRKRMSKAEEFVLGDPCVKLIRTLENAAILIVKSR